MNYVPYEERRRREIQKRGNPEEKEHIRKRQAAAAFTELFGRLRTAGHPDTNAYIEVLKPAQIWHTRNIISTSMRNFRIVEVTEGYHFQAALSRQVTFGEGRSPDGSYWTHIPAVMALDGRIWPARRTGCEEAPDTHQVFGVHPKTVLDLDASSIEHVVSGLRAITKAV